MRHIDGRRVRSLRPAVAECVAGLLVLAGCRAPAVRFPPDPLAVTGTRADYDTDGDGKADFFLLANAAARFDRIAYDRSGDGKPDHVVHLDPLHPALCRHLVIVLDGIPFDVLKEFYESGHLRVFHPPAQLVPPYPVMTDLALADCFGYIPAEGIEAKYYHWRKRSVVGGTGDYLAGKNEPFTRIIDYRTSPLNDAFVYLYPRAIFDKELNDVLRLWRRRKHMELVAYLVSSAGLGSRKGRPGQLYALQRCEQLIHQVLFESNGLAKVTLFADHGQTNVPCKLVNLRKHLKDKGWRMTKKLRGETDAVLIRFGLVTYAAFNTRRPEALATDLLAHEAVELASYAAGDAVVVRTRDAAARIRSADGKTFHYERLKADPLKLGELVADQADGRGLLKATVAARHAYPDALYRLWRAHFGLVEHPPDVLVSLHDRFCSGSGGFAGSVKMASTHGGLNRANSVTFFMSTAGAVAGPLRSEDVPRVIRKIFGRRFPYGR